MEKKKRSIILQALAETLDAVQLRCDQVKSAARINACAMKLKEMASEMAAEEATGDETENEHEA